MSLLNPSNGWWTALAVLVAALLVLVTFVKYTRLWLVLLIGLVPVLGVWTFVKAPEWGLWFPEDVSTHGKGMDQLFYMIMWMVTFTFVLTEVALVWCVFRYHEKVPGKSLFTHGSHKLEMIWTAIPAVALLVIAFAQIGTFKRIKFENHWPTGGPYSAQKPIAHVIAYQFAWLMRYPDENGSFDSVDVVESPFDFVVPVDTDIMFHLKSRDVLHSFFLPNLRLKQDAVPGMTIPMWFKATKVGEYDLICAELCGWGHYKMAGKLIVKSKADYDAWLAHMRAELKSNGKADLASTEEGQ
jgi:cytochrome c oxidase subunit II